MKKILTSNRLYSRILPQDYFRLCKTDNFHTSFSLKDGNELKYNDRLIELFLKGYFMIVSFFIIGTYIYFCVFHQYTFTHLIEINNHSGLFLAVINGFIISEVLSVKGSSPVAILKFIIIASLVVAFNVTPKLINNEHLITTLSILLLFFVLTTVPTNNLLMILKGMQIVFVIELAIVIFQIVDNPVMKAPRFGVGTFGNSGIASCFLVINLPILKYMLDLSNLKYAKLMKVIAIVIVGLISVILQSRTAIIAYSIILSAGLFYYQRKKLVKPIFANCLYLVVSILLLTGVFLTFFKTGSTNGRLLLWEISLKRVNESFWYGIGIGNLSHALPKWQIEYFRATKDLGRESYNVADESYLLFNEFIEMFVETGLIGVITALYLAHVFIKNAASRTPIEIIFSLLGVVACCFTSYPLHCNSILLLMAQYFALSINRAPIKINQFRCVKILTIILALPILVYAKDNFEGICTWQKIIYSPTLSNAEKLVNYGEIYPQLKHNGKFLVSYGELLSISNNNDALAIKVFEESKPYFFSASALQSLYILYYRNEKIEKAIDNLSQLSHLLPNRLYIKYLLARLHLKAGDVEKSKDLLRKVIDTEPKFASEEIIKIKNDAKLLLDSLSTNILLNNKKYLKLQNYEKTKIIFSSRHFDDDNTINYCEL